MVRASERDSPGDDLFSQAVAHQVSSALARFTTVFGKGTGGTMPLASPSRLLASSG